MHFNVTTARVQRLPVPAEKSALVQGVIALMLVALLACPAGLRAGTALQREYEIKAAYLYNFINYIEWPAEALPPAGGKITIGILGENPFGEALDPINGKQIKGRTLEVRHVADAKELAQCHILFISASEKQRVAEWLGKVKNARVLTVSEVEGFAERGGIINFISERNKVRFEINHGVARQLGLTISSDLLKLARIVKTS